MTMSGASDRRDLWCIWIINSWNNVLPNLAANILGNIYCSYQLAAIPPNLPISWSAQVAMHLDLLHFHHHHPHDTLQYV